MNKDAFAISGGDLLKKPMDMNPSGHEVFVKAKFGGGLGRGGNKPAAVEEPAEELVPVEPAPAKTLPVKLSNPRWSEKEGFFDGKISALVDVELPESHANLTRVAFTLFRLDAAGKKEQIDAKDGHADAGQAETEFTLLRPPNRDGKPVESCEYVFTAKHRDSKDAQGPKLPAKASPLKLVLELDHDAEIKKAGHTLVLKSADGAVHASLKAEDGKDEDGILRFEFPGLDPDVSYVLEILDDQGRVAEEIFSDMKHGDWETDGT